MKFKGIFFLHIKFHVFLMEKFTSLIYFSVFCLHFRISQGSQDDNVLASFIFCNEQYLTVFILPLLHVCYLWPLPSFFLWQILIIVWMTILNNIERERVTTGTLPPPMSGELESTDTWFSRMGEGEERRQCKHFYRKQIHSGGLMQGTLLQLMDRSHAAYKRHALNIKAWKNWK